MLCDEIDVSGFRDPVPVAAEVLTAQSFDPVALNRTADFACYGDPQPYFTGFPEAVAQDEIRVLKPASLSG